MPRDSRTLDLFDWEPPKIVRRFEEREIRAATLRARIAHAVSTTMKESGQSREEIARRMTEWLGEEISVHMLNAYASEARDEHTIGYPRLLALVEATGDTRLLQLGSELFGHSVVEDRLLGWIDVGMLADKKQDIGGAFKAAVHAARRGVRL